MEPEMFYSYKKLDEVTYHIADEPNEYLRRWLKNEWDKDATEYPDQSWTPEWLKALSSLEFKLEVIDIKMIALRQSLMGYKNNGYSFEEELAERVVERIEAIKMGTSVMPLVVRGNDMELMDGYTRYASLKKLGAKQVYAYVGYPA